MISTWLSTAAASEPMPEMTASVLVTRGWRGSTNTIAVARYFGAKIVSVAAASSTVATATTAINAARQRRISQTVLMSGEPPTSLRRRSPLTRTASI